MNQQIQYVVENKDILLREKEERRQLRLKRKLEKEKEVAQIDQRMVSGLGSKQSIAELSIHPNQSDLLQPTNSFETKILVNSESQDQYISMVLNTNRQSEKITKKKVLHKKTSL